MSKRRAAKAPDHQGPQAPSAIGAGGMWLLSRGATLFTMAAVVLGVILLYTGARTLGVISVAVSDGFVVGAWVASAWALGRAMWRERWLGPRAGGALGFATEAGIGLGVMSLITLGLGLAGWLNRGTVLLELSAGPVALVALNWAWLRERREVDVGGWLRKPAGWHWLLVVGAPMVGMMLVGGSITPGLLWKPEDPHPYDALEYHLQVPREWYEGGRIVGLRHNVFSYFPYGVEMHYLMAMHARGGPWAAMYQCQLLGAAWALLAATAVYGAVRGAAKEGGAALASAAAVAAVSTPWVVMLGSVAYTETALAFYAALAVAWAVRAVEREPSPLPSPAVPGAGDDVRGRVHAMAVAGLAAGFACGVKYTAVPMVLGAVGVAVTAVALATRDVRRWWRAVLVYGVVGAAVASPWLVRNAVWTGNPVFPLALRQFGRGHFDEVQVKRFEVAHAPTEAFKPMGARVKRLGTEVLGNWQYGAIMREAGEPRAPRQSLVFPPVLWLLCAASLTLAWRRRAAWAVAAFLLTGLVVWVGFTHLLGRFFVLAIPVAALAVGLVRWRAWPAVAAAGAVVGIAVCWSMMHPRMERFAAIAANGLYGLDDLSDFNPPELKELRPGTRVSLIGDAQGFLYRFPTRDFHYRTVFDLPGGAGDMYHAWLGTSEAEARGVLVVNPMEVERLSRTYHGVPGLPAELPGPRDQTFILTR